MARKDAFSDRVDLKRKRYRFVQVKHDCEGIRMPAALVLINVEIGPEADVLRALKKVEGVEEAFAVYGMYDIVARIKADTIDKLNQIVAFGIRKLENVRSTSTMIIVDESSLGMEWIRT